MKTNQEYKNAALDALKGNWTQAVTAVVLFIVAVDLMYFLAWGVEGAASLVSDADSVWLFFVLAGLILLAVLLNGIILIPALVIGIANVFNRFFIKPEGDMFRKMCSLTFSDMGRSFAGMFMMGIITSLYSLLLVVPGIVASMSFFLVPYLLKDRPELTIFETLRLSRKMMEGHKMQLFKLQLSFLGWALLNVLTLGIGALWLLPYAMTTCAAFYQDVKAEYFMKEARQESAL